MTAQLKNNALGYLAADISASDTGVILGSGDGSNFPTLTGAQYFYATLVSAAGTIEIIKVTARTGDALTVERAQEGTIANGFAAGTKLELRVTAGSIEGYVADYVPTYVASYVPTYVSQSAEDGVYTPPGSSAVATTIQNKLRETASVKDFGAVGNGATDDTAAVQAAINSGNAEIYFPEGTYKITSTIDITAKVKLKGVRNDSIISDPNNLDKVFNITADNVEIDGLSFTSTETISTWYLNDTVYRTTRKSYIYANGCDLGVLRNLKLFSKRQGIYLDSCEKWIVDSIVYVGPLGNIVDSVTASAGQTLFSYTFPVFDASYMTVYVDGVVQTLTSDYTVSGVGSASGGTVTFTTPLTGGEDVLIRPEVNDNYVTAFQCNAGGNHTLSNFDGQYTGQVILTGLNSSYNTATNIKGREIHDNGIYNSSGNYNQYVGGNFNNTFGSGIKVRGSGHVVKGFTVTDTNLGVTVTGDGTSVDAYGANGFGTIVQGNTIISHKQVGIEVGVQDGYYPRDVTIDGNTIEASKAPRAGTFTGIRVRVIRGAIITNNNVRGYNTEHGMFIYGASGSEQTESIISNNIVNSGSATAGTDGLRFQYLDDSIVSNNTGSAFTGYFMEFRYCDNNYIHGNMSAAEIINLSTTYACTGNTAINNILSNIAVNEDLNTVYKTQPDYRYGAFTFELGSATGTFGTINYSSQQGFYVKQGKTVHVQGALTTSSVTVGTASGDVYLTGLPYTSSDAGTGAKAAVTLANIEGFSSSTTQPCGGYIGRNEDFIRLEKKAASNGPTTPLAVSDLRTGSAGNTIVFSATYYVD